MLTHLTQGVALLYRRAFHHKIQGSQAQVIGINAFEQVRPVVAGVHELVEVELEDGPDQQQVALV
ncbi:hypothetical protein D3C84_1104790 [compost metagenome]